MKKKLIVYGLIFTLGLALLAGCGKTNDNTSASNGTVVEETKSNEKEPVNEGGETSTEVTVPEEPPIDYEAVYKDLLDSFYVLLYTHGSGYDVLEGQVGVAENARIDDEAMTYVGYAIRDISGDGIPELTISEMKNPKWDSYPSLDVFAVYTCVNGRPVLTFEGWGRNSYFWLGDGRFFNFGSGGAMYTMLGTYKLTEDGTALECEDFYFTYEKDENYEDIGIYHNTTGLWAPDKAEETDLSFDEFWAINEDMLLKIAPFELTSFSTYEYDGELPEIDDCEIEVHYAEDLMVETFIEYVADETEYSRDVMFRVNNGGYVDDFVVNKIYFAAYQDDMAIYEEEPIYYLGNLNYEADFILRMTFFGDMPTYGISYVDRNGNTRHYAITMSGQDGSVQLEEFRAEAVYGFN